MAIAGTGAPKAAKAKVETVSTRQLGAALAEKHEMSNKAALAVIDDAITLITKHLKKGARVRLNGLGILVVRKRAARMGRNPRPAKRSRSRLRRRSPSAPRRS